MKQTRNMIKIKSKKEEYEVFNKLSSEWWDDRGKFKILHNIRPLRIEYILNQVNEGLIKKLEILDIGCGGGLISEPLAKLGGNITGIDFVENNIKIAQKHAKDNNLNINYICDDIDKINLNKKFDIIIMFEILEHLENWETFLKKIKKNLKKNSKIIISTINRNILSKYSAIYLAENILNWVPRNTHDYNKFIKPEEIKNFCKKNSLRFTNPKGLIFNPFDRNWQFSSITTINYFCTISSN